MFGTVFFSVFPVYSPVDVLLEIQYLLLDPGTLFKIGSQTHGTSLLKLFLLLFLFFLTKWTWCCFEIDGFSSSSLDLPMTSHECYS